MRWLRLLVILSTAACAQWKVGIWWELGPDRDSVQAVRFAHALADSFDRHLKAGGGSGAQLARLVFAQPGQLPLAGSDPQEHPDLRDSAIDLEWGVPARLPVPDPLSVEVAWLRALGCPDPSTFAVGWDLFRLQEQGKPLLGTSAFPLLKGLWAHLPAWQLVDTAVDPLCIRLSRMDSVPHGPRLARQGTPLELLAKALPDTFEIRVRDGAGHPAMATIDLWRARADSLRPYAAMLEGSWDTLRTDSSGRIRVRRASWFRGTMTHGRKGSNLQTLVRVRGMGRQTTWTWLEARDVLLADGRLDFSLPSGSSGAWRKAAETFPSQELLAGESDSSGTWVGISLLEKTDLVLRLCEPGGRTLFRSERLSLAAGAWEKKLPIVLSPGSSYELRMDTPTSRRLVRLVAGAGVAAR